MYQALPREHWLPLAWLWRVSPPTPPLPGLPGSHLQEHTGAQWPRETPTQVPGEWSEHRSSQNRQAAHPGQAAQGREGGGAASTRDNGWGSTEATLKAMLNGALSSEGPGAAWLWNSTRAPLGAPRAGSSLHKWGMAAQRGGSLPKATQQQRLGGQQPGDARSSG